jgi:peroxiredoxin
VDSKITFKSKPLSLVGRRVKEGGSAPHFFAVDNGLNEVELSGYKDSVKIIASFYRWDNVIKSGGTS